MGWKIDEIDRKIIENLRENANIANAKLGKKVGLSEPATRRRVANLVSRGVIRKFTIEVEEGGGVQAIFLISGSAHYSAKKLCEALSSMPGVGSVWELSGDFDLALTLFAPSMDELNKRIDGIREMKEVARTESKIILKKWR